MPHISGTSLLKDAKNFLNGSVYGVTLIIPGVSGTIFAIMLGFYEELLYTVNHFRENYRKNIRYLAVFLLGVAAGAITFSSLILFLLEYHPFPTILFFTGLLAGTIPLVATKAKGSAQRIMPREIFLSAFFLTALVALSLIVTADTIYPTDALNAMTVGLALFVFFAGIINGATLVIPGLSGSFLLLIMGLYPLIIYSISSIGSFFGEPGNFLLLRNISMILLPYGIGALVGCLGMARIMEKLMRNFHVSVYAAILGLLLGSLFILTRDHLLGGDIPIAALVIGIALFCIGCVLSYILGKKH